MRVTSGSLRGRIIASPFGDDIRPASDRVRQSIFNILGSAPFVMDMDFDLHGARVLDLFCGTGSYGIESLSRGASFCTFIDQDAALVRRNIVNLSLEKQAKILQQNLQKSPNLKGIDSIDLIFCDPPYGQNLVAPLLPKIMPLYPAALWVIESEPNLTLPHDTILLDQRLYGKVCISFIKTA
jgi:16S rRNA (guanine966-N2)-methyltransferase